MVNNNETMILSEILDITNVQAIFDAMHDGIMIIDKDYRIIYYNHAMEKIEGLNAEEVIGKLLLEVFPYQTYEKNTIMQAIQEDKQFDDFIQSYITSKGREVTTINTTVPIKIGSNIVGALETTKDISSARKLTEKIIELQNKLYKAHKDGKSDGNQASGCHYSFQDIIGESYPLKKSLEYAEKASYTSSSVLICGETGTGKEMFAQSIHNNSLRRNRPFIAVNCAALPGELLEGILFGTVRGGFTGSVDRPGLFEQADGGTLLLDEIDSMDHNLQAKLLRVLQEGFVRRVGGTKDIKLDIRLISTANSNLIEAMEKGMFRRDLYYRLSVVNLVIPPLRERTDDILFLADYFMREYNSIFCKNVESFSLEVINLFEKYYWPGNIREIQHCIEGIMNIIGDERIIKLEHIPPDITGTCKTEKKLKSIYTSKKSLNTIVDSVEKTTILETLSLTKGNVVKAAQLMGIKRQTLQYKMKKYGITKEKSEISWND